MVKNLFMSSPYPYNIPRWGATVKRSSVKGMSEHLKPAYGLASHAAGVKPANKYIMVGPAAVANHDTEPQARTRTPILFHSYEITDFHLSPLIEKVRKDTRPLLLSRHK